MLGAPFHVFIDSDYRINGTESNFTIAINLPKDNNFDSVALMQASIPKSFYIVAAPYNTFTLQEGVSQVTITVTPGNYSMTSFRTLLISNLNTNSPNHWTYNIKQPNIASEPSTGKYTFSVTGNSSQPSFIFPSTSGLYRQMGFDFNSTNAFVAGSLVSQNVVNFNTLNGLMILSDLIEGKAADPTHGSAVLQEIFSFNTYDYSNINFISSDILANGKKIKSTNTSIAQFIITDLDGYELGFNKNPLNFSLCFFKRDPLNQLQLQDLKMKWYNDILGKKDIGDVSSINTFDPPR